MGTFSVTCLVAVLMMVSYAHAAGNGECPEVRQVHSCSPKCVQSYECTGGKVCCPNQCNLKSCAEPAKYSSGSGSGNKYSGSSGAGVYCNNEKCSPFETCKLDRATNRMRCQRA